MSEKSTFSKNLTKARTAKGWSQEGAAREIGIKRAKYAAYEESRAEPSHKTMKRICEAFDIHDLNAFIHDENYFEIKISPESLYRIYSRLPIMKRKAIDFIIGLDC